ncbi:guanine nucleotide-binding protein subunit alpha [Sorochytrium milnesiophthora]
MFCGNNDTERQRAMKIHSEIERKIAKDRKSLDTEVKLLLLGAGESGKSTVFKQMQLIYGSGYSDADRVAVRSVIFSNIAAGMRTIIEAVMSDANGSLLPREKVFDIEENDCRTIYACATVVQSDAMPPELANAVLNVWKSAPVRAILSKNAEFQLPVSLNYMDEFERIRQPGYIPTDQDILRMRVKTTAIVEKSFLVNEFVYRIIDVGGQRSERRKWVHCFDDVTAIIFVVAISEYDQVLEEDHNMNRLKEAIMLFSSVCNSEWFDKIPVILFLNKIDIFDTKIAKSNPRLHFSNYPDIIQGGCRLISYAH